MLEYLSQETIFFFKKKKKNIRNSPCEFNMEKLLLYQTDKFLQWNDQFDRWGGAVSILFLNFIKVLDTVPHKVLIEKHKLDGQAVR